MHYGLKAPKYLVVQLLHLGGKAEMPKKHTFEKYIYSNTSESNVHAQISLALKLLTFYVFGKKIVFYLELG